MAITKDYPNTNWATATEVTSEPRIIYPFKRWGEESGYIVERDYVQARANYNPMALDTTDATYTTAYLIEETVPQTIESELIKFTRRFATVPSAFTTWQHEVFTFPGYYNSYATSSSYRPPLPKTVAIKVDHSFDQTTDPEDDFPTSSQPFLPQSYYGEYIEYVDNFSSPTITVYQTYVSGGTYLQVRHNQFSRAYGTGNIWEQMKFTTVAA